MLRPAYIVSLGLLAFNDGWLKGNGPSWLSGKLSDFAGLFFAPILLLVLIELLPPLQKSDYFTSRRVASYGAIGFVFAAAQVSDIGAKVYEGVFLPARWLPTWADGFALTQDPTDLVALMALAASYVWSSRALREQGGSLLGRERH